MSDKQLTVYEFAQKVKAKYPEYSDIDDVELAKKIVAKYPEYENIVSFEEPKKKEESTPSVSSVGESVSPEETPEVKQHKKSFLDYLSETSPIGTGPLDLSEGRVLRDQPTLMEVLKENPEYGNKMVNRSVAAAKTGILLAEADAGLRSVDFEEIADIQKVIQQNQPKEGDFFYNKNDGFVGFMYDLGRTLPESFISMGAAAETPLTAASVGTGAAAGTVVPGIGTAVGAAGGFAFATSAINEYGTTIMAMLDEEGIDITDAEELKKAFANEELIGKIKSKAAKRAGVIGLIDGISGGVAGKVSKKIVGEVGEEIIEQLAKGTAEEVIEQSSKAGRKILYKDVVETTVESLAGGTGEALGSLAAGQEISLRDVLLETLADPTSKIVSTGGSKAQSFMDGVSKNLEGSGNITEAQKNLLKLAKKDPKRFQDVVAASQYRNAGQIKQINAKIASLKESSEFGKDKSIDKLIGQLQRRKANLQMRTMSELRGADEAQLSQLSELGTEIEELNAKYSDGSLTGDAQQAVKEAINDKLEEFDAKYKEFGQDIEFSDRGDRAVELDEEVKETEEVKIDREIFSEEDKKAVSDLEEQLKTAVADKDTKKVQELTNSIIEIENKYRDVEATEAPTEEAEVTTEAPTEETPTEEAPAEEVAEEAPAEEAVIEEVDQEAIGVEENIIADSEFRIEDLQSEIDIEKGNIKEAKDKAKEDTAAVRKSKLPKEEKAERIEEIKAELQDTLDELNGNIGIYKEDINAYKSEIRKANKRISKLKTPKVVAKPAPKKKAKEQIKTEEVEITLLEENGSVKPLTKSGPTTDPRNVQTGKMTIEYGDKGITFKTTEDTGRMKEEGGEIFVSNEQISKMPNIGKFEKNTKEYAQHVASMSGIADPKPDIDPIEGLMSRAIKVEDIGKEGTASAKRFTAKQGEQLTAMVNNFEKILKSSGARRVKVLFFNQGDSVAYRSYKTGKDSFASKGSFFDNTIVVNIDSADMSTLPHEMLHAYISSVKMNNKKIVQFTNAIENELNKGSNSERELAKELAAFRDRYIEEEVYGKGKTKEDALIAEEFLAQYVGLLSTASENMPKAKQLSFIDKIRAAVVKFLSKIGIVDKNLVAKIKTREDALNFINGFVDALQGRVDLIGEAKVNPEKSAVVNSENPYQASRFQIEVPVGSRIANKPLKDARTIAISYMESKGLKHIDGNIITKVDEKSAKRISDAYAAMKNEPTNPEVAAAYKAMAEETVDQYEAIIKGGYKVEVNNNEPYNNSNELIEDLRKNKNMRIFSTDSGFGDQGITAKQRKENPMLAETKYKDVNGRTLLVNDIFRFVHDFFGHAERGNGFGPIGEENAWDVHSRMFSPLARKALTAETRGQNSYVNYSGINTEAFKLRDKGRELRKQGKFEEAQKFTDQAYDMMKFAPQKVGLLPDEFVANPYLAEEVEESEPVTREQIDAVKIISLDTPKQKAKKEAVAEVLNGFAESQLAPNSSEQDLVSRFLNNIFEESLYTLKKGPRESGMTWYIEDITEFENKMTVLLPELSDPKQMKLFKQVLAITSSGTNPNQNLQTAYTLWVRSNGSAVNFAKNWGEDKISFITKKGVAIGTGIIVSETKTKYVVQKVDALGKPEVFKNGAPKLFEAKKNDLKDGYPKPAGFTARGNIVAQQLTKIEKVYEAVGKDINKLIEFFENPQPVSELRKYNKGVPDIDGNVRKVAVGKRNGAFIFGEKIGAFYQNMIGIGDTITMDLWWSRTWNRYMGTMLSTIDGKQAIQETPRTDRERDVMRKAVTLAAKKLNLDVSELQAVIWYFEQELWTKAGNVSPSFSYVTATDALNNKIKTDEETQKRFSEARADLTAAEKRRQDAIARANNIIAEGGIQGDIVREQIDFAGIEMKTKETAGNTDPAIKTGGTAYVPVSTLYNLMDMRGGDRDGLYETAEDKKRVQNLVEAFKKEGFEYKGSDALYVDIDADGYGWIGEGNHRVLAARELGMSHLPVRVEFGAARDSKSIYKKDWARVPTQVVSKEKIAELKEKAEPFYHIKYASIWETDLPTNPEPSRDVARQQIEWQNSLFGKGQVNPAIVNRNTVVQQAAYDLLTGQITNDEYQEVVRITQSIDPITQFFLPASTKDMAEALDSNKGKLLNVQLEDGTEVGLRLDIPAYKNRNIWVVSIHDSGKAGKSLSYGSVAWATDVTFGSNPKVAAFIAAGQNLDTGKKQDKTTIARMHGKWKNFEGKTKEERDASAVKKVDEIVAIESSFAGAGRKGSPWRQIGMNPFRHSYFYDRRNGKPVVGASEVVQIGGLVYAKDVLYADRNDMAFEVSGYKDANGDPVRFQLELDDMKIQPSVYKKNIFQKIASQFVWTNIEKQARILFESKEGQVTLAVKEGREISKKLRRLAKDKETLDMISNYMEGIDRTAISKKLSKTTKGVRILDLLRDADAMVESFGNQIVDDPAFETLATELKFAITNNAGTYLKTRYRFFTDKKYKIKDKARAKAIQAERDMIVARQLSVLKKAGLSEEEINQTIQDSLSDIDKQAHESIDLYINKLENIKKAPSVTGADIRIPSSSFQMKKDIAYHIQELLGVEKDPVTRFSATIQAQANILYKGRMVQGLLDVSQGLWDEYILDSDPDPVKAPLYKFVKDPYSPLNGKYVHEEIMNIFDRKPLYESDKAWLQGYFSLLKLGRKSKVIWNIPTWRKNLTGGWYFMLANGVLANPRMYKDLKDRLALTVDSDRIMTDPQTKAWLKVMGKKGLLGANVDAQLIGINDAAYQYMYDGDEKAYKRAFKKVYSSLSNFDKFLQEKYSAVDDYTKLVIFRMEVESFAMKIYGKEYESLTESQKDRVHDDAAEFVKQNTPTFSRLPKFYDKLAVIPVFGDFVSFQFESIRSMSSNILNGVDDMKIAINGVDKNGNKLNEEQVKAYKASAGKRLVGTLSALALKYAMVEGFQQLFLDDEDEELAEDAKRVSPEWMKGQSLIVKSIKKNGDVRVYNYSSEDPYGTVGDLTSPAGWGSLLNTFIRPNIAADYIFRAVKGEDIYGRKLFDKSDTAVENALAFLGYTAKTFIVPPFISSSYRDVVSKNEKNAIDLFTDGETAKDLTYTIGERSLMRDYQYNVLDQFRYSVKDIASNKPLKDAGNIDKRYRHLESVREDFYAIKRIAIAKGNIKLARDAQNIIKRNFDKEEERFILNNLKRR